MTASSTTSHVRRTAALSALVATSLALAACGSGGTNAEDKTGEASPSASASASETGFKVNLDDCEDPDAVKAKITDKFVLGYSAPLSGPVAGVVELANTGYKARIKELNDAGGIDGVKIEISYKDDAFSPDKAKANGTEFLQKDKVNGVNTFGAGQVGAMVDDVMAACTPFLYPSSSDAQYNDISKYPWLVQFLPAATVETKFLTSYIKDKVKSPKIALIENPTASGKAMAKAFKEAAQAAGLEIVKEMEDTDPNAAATAAMEATANVVYHAGVTGSCGAFDSARARIGYKPELELKASNCVNAAEYIAAGDAADGIVVAKYVKDPGDPSLASDPGVKHYLEVLAGAPTANNAITVSGYLSADLMINTLTQASKSKDGLTRESIIKAARDQAYKSPMLLDGIEWLSTPERPAGVSGFAPYKWSVADQRFVSAGPAIKVD